MARALDKCSPLVYQLTMEKRAVEGLHCQECGASRIYYPEVHRLDGDRRNNLPSNIVLVCPFCDTHLTTRLNHEDILILKMRGLSNAEIGRVLGISRERVRQVYKRYESELAQLSNGKVDDLVRLAQFRQNRLIARRALKRRIGKKRIRKIILSMINKPITETGGKRR